MATIGYVAVAAIVDLDLFLNSYVPLLPGLAILWTEIGLGIIASMVAHYLTKRAVAMKGVGIEQNAVMRQMLVTGDFRLLWTVYGGMLLLGLVMTVLSVHFGGVMLSVLVLLFAFPLPMTLDAMNDVYWMRKFQSGAK